MHVLRRSSHLSYRILQEYLRSMKCLGSMSTTFFYRFKSLFIILFSSGTQQLIKSTYLSIIFYLLSSYSRNIPRSCIPLEYLFEILVLSKVKSLRILSLLLTYITYSAFRQIDSVIFIDILNNKIFFGINCNITFYQLFVYKHCFIIQVNFTISYDKLKSEHVITVNFKLFQNKRLLIYSIRLSKNIPMT